MLQIGLGTGSLPFALRGQALKVDVVEIDPAVVVFARRYFDFPVTGDIYEEDARTFLRQTDRRYDLVVHDTFTGGTTPEHMLSLEVLRQIHNILRPEGVMVLNFAGYQSGPNAEASWAVARTLRSVFHTVRAFRDSAPDDHPEAAGNIVFFASDHDLNFEVPPDASFENSTSRHVLRSFQRWEVLKEVPDGPVVTDARNPLGRLQLPIAEEHFTAMNELLPVDVWLH
jgi:spermidine synthase